MKTNQSVHVFWWFIYLYLQVTITLKDNNDNSPIFTTPDRITVMENAQSGAPVYQFSATDADRGRSGQIEYSLAGDDSQYFSVRPNDGVLSVTGELDREIPCLST